VFRQKRSFANVAGTVMAADPRSTVKICPLNAFSGLAPSPGGLNRGSRHVPVHVGGSDGSITPFAVVSL
jgi:hypothetical protein